MVKAIYSMVSGLAMFSVCVVATLPLFGCGSPPACGGCTGPATAGVACTGAAPCPTKSCTATKGLGTTPIYTCV